MILAEHLDDQVPIVQMWANVVPSHSADAVRAAFRSHEPGLGQLAQGDVEMSMDPNEGETTSSDLPMTTPSRSSELEGLRHLLRFLEGSLLKMYESGRIVPPAGDTETDTEMEWTDDQNLYVNLRLVGRVGPDIDVSFHLDTCTIRVQR